MRRRQFISLLGSAAAAWPLAAEAQQTAPMRRVGVLMHLAAEDREGQSRVAAFVQGLQGAGWTIGRDLNVDLRWAGGDADLFRKYAAELVALVPDALMASATPSVRALQLATRAIPIVFVLVPDAVGGGFVESLAHPGGNTTGFTVYEYGVSAKFLELLRQVAPKVTRVAVLRDPTNPGGIGQFAAIQGAAPSVGMEVSPIGVDDAGTIERGITAFAREPNGGLIVLPQPTTVMHRDLIIKLASQFRLPAIYSGPAFVAEGGLISYAPDLVDQYRSAAGYVDRILKGEKPADLPVQAPTKFELVVNLKTAKELGLVIPQTLLATADEVIE
jgi:putative ABC transport system substrate-binding protein